MFEELAPLLWNTACIATILLQEIISVYPAISSLQLTHAQSIRVCNVLALLQCLASHPETRMPFINANMPQYFYPFLQSTSKLPQFEYLRVASLGVIGALVK
ncbi:cell differentiation RCD1-like protein, partial [Trifolium pratense]